MSVNDYSGNVARFTGFADLYDAYRPSPPAGLAAFIAQHTHRERPELVVDLGSGTGLSTRYWAEHAERAIGIEPTADMRRQAEITAAAPNISYRDGLSHQTGLPDQSADVVVCMQSLHWMEPESTFAEAGRILRADGAFVACDYDWPPFSGSKEADHAFAACIRIGRQLEQERGVAADVRHWAKNGHFERMRSSGRFKFLVESVLRHEDVGNDSRLVALLLSQGYIMALRRAGVSEAELGIDRLRDIAQRTIGASPCSFVWSARVRLGLVWRDQSRHCTPA